MTTFVSQVSSDFPSITEKSFLATFHLFGQFLFQFCCFVFRLYFDPPPLQFHFQFSILKQFYYCIVIQMYYLLLIYHVM